MQETTVFRNNHVPLSVIFPTALLYKHGSLKPLFQSHWVVVVQRSQKPGLLRSWVTQGTLFLETFGYFWMPGHKQSAVDLAMDVVGLHLLWAARAVKTLLGKQSIEHTVHSAENKIKDEVMSLEQGCKDEGKSPNTRKTRVWKQQKCKPVVIAAQCCRAKMYLMRKQMRIKIRR